MKHITGRTETYITWETEGEEREKYWELALSHYAGYEKYEAVPVGRSLS